MTHTFQTPRILVVSILVGAAALCSCANTRTGSDRASANSAKEIRMQEYNKFAQDILSILQERLVEERKQLGRPVVLAIGDFKNKTSNPLADFGRHKDIMYGRIRKTLVNSGLAQVNMGVKDLGGEVDSLLQSISSLRDSIEYDQSTVAGPGSKIAPDFIVWGDIISITFKDGRNTNYDYALDLRLIDARTGLTVFEDQVQLSKQFTKGIFGS